MKVSGDSKDFREKNKEPIVHIYFNQYCGGNTVYRRTQNIHVKGLDIVEVRALVWKALKDKVRGDEITD